MARRNAAYHSRFFVAQLSAGAALLLIASCAAANIDIAACNPTSDDMLGPYYIAGTDVTDNLNRFDKSGDPLLVEGRVFSSAEGNAPLAQAEIEVWQTDGAGDYHPADNGDATDFEDLDLDMRGTVQADAYGVYRYQTLVPGRYFPRPRHFHYRVAAPGHETLVTQLYITGDGLFRQAGSPCRHAPLEADGDGFRYAAPPIYLKPE